ncbi:hypothetical protein DID73_00430 [Candidatus Marinamargulisbacteria bacterium SCGC AG-343-K17]|nr:hypothetical protein DID73_00430 [Candidatus Marinamargulisbacteria bacterium SCGC AG-343-K17]
MIHKAPQNTQEIFQNNLRAIGVPPAHQVNSNTAHHTNKQELNATTAPRETHPNTLSEPMSSPATQHTSPTLSNTAIDALRQDNALREQLKRLERENATLKQENAALREQLSIKDDLMNKYADAVKSYNQLSNMQKEGWEKAEKKSTH